MSLSFANPLGFWALLGIPAVLAIHFLQRRAKRTVVSTLFLLEQLRRESAGGPRVERLRSSIPLWLQLLMVLLMTWLLVQPRWLEKSPVQRIAVVLDGSASMMVSRERAEKEVPAMLSRLSTLGTQAEYFLMDTRLEAEHLYYGSERSALLAAMKLWEPSAGTHDSSPALRLARSLVGAEGLVVLVTDHVQPELPFSARQLALGEPLQNAGLAGTEVTEEDGRTVWKATLRNYGTEPRQREWWLELPGGVSTVHSPVALAPGQTMQLSGEYPADAAGITLRISPDEFTADDSAPLLKPKAKTLKVLLPPALPDDDGATLYQKLFTSLPDTEIAADEASADVVAVHYDPLDPKTPTRPACVFLRDPRPDAPVLTGMVLAEKHPFMEGLNWNGLRCQDVIPMPVRDSDEVLLWQGQRALLFLRGAPEARQLCFNFDLRKSNARRLSAFVIAAHRFFDDVRSRKVALEERNAECAQKLRPAVNTGADAPPVVLSWNAGDRTRRKEYSPAQARIIAAPDLPATFEIRQGEELLVRGAAHFADVREADFTAAGKADEVKDAAAAMVERQSREDHYWRIWALALLAALVGSWYFLGRRTRQSAAETPAALA